MPDDAGASIEVVPGGPMLVRGAALGRLVHDGEAWTVEPLEAGSRAALCRCGRSSTMPVCDRTAPYGCFEEEPPTSPEPAPFRWTVPDPEGPPTAALKPDGPVRVAGGVAITYAGEPVAPRDRTSLCRCGASRCQPLCDSSHKVVGYRG